MIKIMMLMRYLCIGTCIYDGIAFGKVASLNAHRYEKIETVLRTIPQSPKKDLL